VTILLCYKYIFECAVCLMSRDVYSNGFNTADKGGLSSDD